MVRCAKRLVAVSVIMVLGVWVGLMPADALEIPSPQVIPSSVVPGESFIVKGVRDCVPGNTLTISVPGLQISANVSGDADWQVQMTVPLGAAPGTYQVAVNGSSCIFPNGQLTVPEYLEMVKTVGTEPGVCAASSNISVQAGTTVYYCYAVTNHTFSTLRTHNLTDDKLGTLLNHVAFDLAPGASTNTITLGKAIAAVVEGTTINTATWTSQTDAGNTFTVSGAARVTVTASTTTIQGVAAATSPRFTG